MLHQNQRRRSHANRESKERKRFSYLFEGDSSQCLFYIYLKGQLMFPLYFHYEDVSRQDPLLKLNHANVMEVPGLCKIRVVPKAAPSIKNGKLAMEIPCDPDLPRDKHRYKLSKLPRNSSFARVRHKEIVLVATTKGLAPQLVYKQAMHYTPHVDLAFNSVEHIMRDVEGGWLLRYMHANGARYVLPWGQMSFWGATVITSLASAIPVVGDTIVTWLWGGFSVDNATLNREPNSASGWTGSWIDRWMRPEEGQEVTSSSAEPRVVEQAGTSTSRPRPSSPESPLPSISSKGDSWIEEAYGGGGAAPHPNPEEINDAAPPIAAQQAPSVEEIRHQVDAFTSSYNRIKMRSDILIEINEQLDLHNATPEKRFQILEGIRILSNLQGPQRPVSGVKAGNALIAFIRAWEQQ
ncbi:hypothetical protein SASPL_155535 (mitochondrion) [Salvia splendens]|uniref:Cytochrome b/b6 N-terminal region profile domain-containing protein n=1 Tax=Salvia splendens TaxID=180675 RepID=A0A8X8VYF3_SALSN|nr:hypothetical protein SASPL_156342 [Salvia splendens]KAG6384680.1 hypothetical protein SASPL_155535 [Salvia splendens]